MSKELIEAFREYLTVNKGLSSSSISAYINDIEQFFNFSKKPLLKRDVSNIVEFLTKFDNKRTLNRKLSSINRFYDFAKELEFGVVDINLPSSKVPATLPIYLNHEQIMEAVGNIDIKSWLDLRDRALILFLYATGLRVSEAVNAKIDDIDGILISTTPNSNSLAKL